MTIIVILLMLACVTLLGVDCFLFMQLREARKEHGQYACFAAKLRNEMDEMKWDHISADLTLEKEIENWKIARNIYAETLGRVAGERDALQEKYSAVMCPTNNHIWHDGRCKRCGAWREDFAIIGESFIKVGPKPSVSEVRKDA